MFQLFHREIQQRERSIRLQDVCGRDILGSWIHRGKPRVQLEIAFFLVFSFFSSYPLLTSKDPDFTVPYRSYRTVPYRMYTGKFLASRGWEGEGWARF
jgi:hypothetical protein